MIAKYIYDVGLEGDKRIAEQLEVVNKVLNSVVIVPEGDRKQAADLDKLDRFLGSLAASYDLLYSAMDAMAFIEIIAITANQIDAHLRLSLVITKQLEEKTDNIEIRYLFQADGEKGIMERKVFDDALKFQVIDLETFDSLNELYNLRNRVIHRYIISDIKSRDLFAIAGKYLSALEKTRLILRDFEQKQAVVPYGLYGTKSGKTSITDDAIRRLYAKANDKHLLEKYKRSVRDRKS